MPKVKRRDLDSILGDVECVVEVVNGSLIEVRAEHPYAAMRCSTVMRLRKVDSQNRTDLIGRSQTSCKIVGGILIFCGGGVTCVMDPLG